MAPKLGAASPHIQRWCKVIHTKSALCRCRGPNSARLWRQTDEAGQENLRQCVCVTEEILTEHPYACAYFRPADAQFQGNHTRPIAVEVATPLLKIKAPQAG